jgi:hypothetical protein
LGDLGEVVTAAGAEAVQEHLDGCTGPRSDLHQPDAGAGDPAQTMPVDRTM